jgi:hypothetical protein
MSKYDMTVQELYDEMTLCSEALHNLDAEHARVKAMFQDQLAVLNRKRNAARMRVIRAKERYETASALEKARQTAVPSTASLFANGQAGNE